MGYDGTTRKIELLLLCSLAFVVLGMTQFGSSFSQGPNNRNVSVDTQVNITGSIPEIRRILIENPITLNAGSLKTVTCNATIEDFNGADDIDTVNATFFRTTASLTDPDDNNTHYTNTSCAVDNTDGNFANYTCSFDLSYYAQNGTWNCSVQVNDTGGLNSTESNLTNISALLALNVTTLIDYGQMAMGDTSGSEEANVSNLGNVDMNVSVEGYARNISDGLSMVCEQGNLSVGLQHFASNATAAYAEMQELTSSQQQILLMTTPKAVNDSGTQNTTYWQLFLDPTENAFGICNGTIIFQAEQS